MNSEVSNNFFKAQMHNSRPISIDISYFKQPLTSAVFLKVNICIKLLITNDNLINITFTEQL